MIRILSPSRRVMAFATAAPFVIAACSTTASDIASDPPTTAVEAVSPAVAEAPPSTTAELESELEPEEPTWLDIELTDADSGETYTLASLAGNVVAIEPMAIWCSNCKRQQDNVKTAYDEIESSGVTYISLGIDPAENPQALSKYAERRGYEWTFSQSPVELSRALSDIFGPQVLSAPSTPLIVLDANGEIVVQEFGFHGPEKLLDILGEAA